VSDLPERIQRGIAALRRGKPLEAAEDLHAVWSDVDFRAADDLRDVRARVAALLAQAWLDAGQAPRAEVPLREALAGARELGDDAGLQMLKELETRLTNGLSEARAREAEARRLARLAETPLEVLLEQATTPLARADAMIRKATAEIEFGRGEAAAPIARDAARLAREHRAVREEVLARMTVARAEPSAARDELLTALAVAESAGEFNLVGAIARAAEIAGVELPRHRFADRDTA
jgi:hypothetical protein